MSKHSETARQMIISAGAGWGDVGGGLLAAGASVTYTGGVAALLACAVAVPLARIVATTRGSRDVARDRRDRREVVQATAAGVNGGGSTVGVFLSYARADQDFARHLDGRLAGSGRRVWVDWQDIAPSARWRAEIFAAIEAAGAFVFVMSPDSLTSQVCRDELRHAFAMNKRVVPVVIADIAHVAVPADLAALNWLSFTGSDDFERSFEAVIRAVDTDLEWVKAHTRLTVQALEWEAKSDKNLLLRGAELEAAEQALAARPANPEPTATQSQFVLASRRAATGRQRSVLVVSLVVVVTVAVLASVAWVQRGQARDQARSARSGQLAANARLQLGADPEVGLQLAILAYQEKPTAEAESVLRQAVVDSRERATLRGHQGIVASAAFSPDGQRVVSAGQDGTVRVWPLTGGGQPLILRGHQGAVYGAAFSPDGQRVVSAGQDGTVRVWPLTGGGPPLILRGHEAGVITAAFSPDGQHVVSAGGADGTVRVWNVASGGDPVILRGHQGSVTDVGFSSDGQRIVSAGSDGTALVWAWTTGGKPIVLHHDKQGAVLSAAFSPAGFVVTAAVDGIVKVWVPVPDGGPTGPLMLRGHRGAVEGARFSPDGEQVVTAGADGTVRVWACSKGGQADVLRGHEGIVASGAFSPDGEQVVTAGADGTVRVWADSSGDPVVLRGHQDAATSAAFSPDGQQVLSAGVDGTVRVWPLTGGGVPLVLHGHQGIVESAAFSRDGQRVVSAGDDGTVRVWTLTGGGVPLVLHGHSGPVLGAKFSPDGEQVVSAGADGTVRVWTLADAKGPLVLHGHVGPVYSAAFSPDSQRVVSAGDDGTVRVWTLADAKGPLVLHGHVGAVSSAAFSTDGDGPPVEGVTVLLTGVKHHCLDLQTAKVAQQGPQAAIPGRLVVTAEMVSDYHLSVDTQVDVDAEDLSTARVALRRQVSPPPTLGNGCTNSLGQLVTFSRGNHYCGQQVGTRP